MKRDMDLIRDIMLKIEAGTDVFPAVDEEALVMMEDGDRIAAQQEEERFRHHLLLIEEVGYAEITWYMDGSANVGFLTNRGHDFLDTVRDPKIWKATKEGARKAGGFSLDILMALGKGLIKTQIEKATGVTIDL